MSKPLTILFQPGKSVTVPKELIAYAFKQRKECGAFVTKGSAKTHNDFLKNICTWLVLKNITTSGIIQNYRLQLSDIAAYGKIKRATLEKRISTLEAEGLLRREHKHLKIVSWQKLAAKYSISITEKIHVLYDTSEKAHLQDTLATIYIQDNKEPGRVQYHNKINGHPQQKLELANLFFALRSEHTKKAYTEAEYYSKLYSDEEYFRTLHRKLRVRSFEDKEVGLSSFDIVHTKCSANPDIELTTATHAKHFNYKVLERKAANGKDQSYSMGFHHLKRRLVAVELLTVKKRMVESEWRAHKDEKQCHCTWIEKKKTTMWRLPDELIINQEAIYGAKTVA